LYWLQISEALHESSSTHFTRLELLGHLALLQACVDMDSLKAYVDENVSDLKDFIASVAKKLPMPVKFTTEQKRLGDLGFSVSRSSFWWGQIH